MSSSTAEVEKAMDPPTETQAVINDCFRSLSTKNDDPEVMLSEAFQRLSKGQDNAHVSANDLVCAMKHIGLDLTLEQVKETILQVKSISKTEKQEQINCDEFIKIAK